MKVTYGRDSENGNLFENTRLNNLNDAWNKIRSKILYALTNKLKSIFLVKFLVLPCCSLGHSNQFK